jgi:YVTN family beta-propeller protein
MMRRLGFVVGLLAMGAVARADPVHFEVWVTNEKSNDVTVIDGVTGKVVGTIAVG